MLRRTFLYALRPRARPLGAPLTTVLKPEAVLVTGGSGYLGALIAGTLLASDSRHVLLPIREHHDQQQLATQIAFGLSVMGQSFSQEHRARLHFLPLPPLDQLHALDGLTKDFRVTELVHSAGCLDYFDKERLEAINVGYTRDISALAKRWGVDRLVYVSTAFASGYVPGQAPEALHTEPSEDPTDYSETKRRAEHAVADSGVPWLILRPSIVIGTHDRGLYTGKRYGVYQLWNGLERLMCRKYEPLMHAVGPNTPIAMVHQDSFQWGFAAALEHLGTGRAVHLTSKYATSPTLRQFWELWNGDVSRPEEVIYYDSPDDVDMRAIPTRQRAFMSLGLVNLQIASRHWDFAVDTLDELRASKGLNFPDVTLDTLALCQRRFIGESAQIRKFKQRYGAQMPETTRVRQRS